MSIFLSAAFYYHNDRNRHRRNYANSGQNPLEHRELSLVLLDFLLDRFKPIVLICQLFALAINSFGCVVEMDFHLVHEFKNVVHLLVYRITLSEKQW